MDGGETVCSNDDIESGAEWNSEDIFREDGINAPDEKYIFSDVDKEFIQKNIELKQEIYNTIVLSPRIYSKQSQSLKILNDYILALKYIYLLFKNNTCKENCKEILDSKLNSIPHLRVKNFLSKIKGSIENKMLWMKQFFVKNNISDNIPYDHKLLLCYIEYPYDFSYKSLLPD
jgi:hypothetical protein